MECHSRRALGLRIAQRFCATGEGFLLNEAWTLVAIYLTGPWRAALVEVVTYNHRQAEHSLVDRTRS